MFVLGFRGSGFRCDGFRGLRVFEVARSGFVRVRGFEVRGFGLGVVRGSGFRVRLFGRSGFRG